MIVKYKYSKTNMDTFELEYRTFLVIMSSLPNICKVCYELGVGHMNYQDINIEDEKIISHYDVENLNGLILQYPEAVI